MVSRWLKRHCRHLLLLAAAAGIILLYALVDPSATPLMPRCPLLAATGLRCPGCGSQRMFHALLTGDLPAAWGFNPFLLCALPPLLFMGWLETRRDRYPTLYSRVYAPATCIVAALLVAAWFIARNIFGL